MLSRTKITEFKSVGGEKGKAMREKVRKGKEKPVRSSKSVSTHDATNTKWLDEILEMTDQVQMVMAYAATHPPCLSVPDAGTEEEFIKSAKQVYREAHIPTLKRGPRPKEAFAVNILAYFSRMRRRQLTKSQMTKLLTNRRLLGPDTLSKNTAEKYVRLFCLAGQDLESFSQKDKDWLCQEFGSASLSLEWWRDKMLGPWLSEGFRRSGLVEEIRKIIEEYTPTELQQERNKLEAARNQLHEQYAKELRGSTKVQEGLTDTSEFGKKFFEHLLSGPP